MKYIGIVNEIKENHKSGFYGRKPIKKEDAKTLLKNITENFNWNNTGLLALSILNPIGGISAFLGTKLLQNALVKNKTTISTNISLQQPFNSKNGELLIFTNESLINDYSINNSKFLYGLFDNFLIPNLAFERIMKSKGGSELNIIGRNNLPKNLKHINNGHFNEGIYVIHPKNENFLIPLNNSNKLIESLILEETIRAYEALGAKRIVINDITKNDFNANVQAKKVNVETNFKREEELLREKKFGKGTFSPERALNNKYFIQDIPSIMTTIEGRIEGNQTEEKFKETINLSIGLDTNVLDLFKGGLNYNYIREWSFEVEFYDKNEIKLENNNG